MKKFIDEYGAIIVVLIVIFIVIFVAWICNQSIESIPGTR